MTDLRLLPVHDDFDTGPFFDAARNHELVIQCCNGCDAVLHVPRKYCRICGSWDTRWQRVSGNATLHTWTVIRHTVHTAYPAPYTVILVKLDDDGGGAHLVGSLPGTPELHMDQPM